MCIRDSNGIAHLLMPVVTEPKKASLALRNMVKEMNRRYEIFAREEVRDISAYNERLAAGGCEGEPLPYYVVIIDELADLMLVAPGEVEDSIARLAQMSRAAGIHLIIATQLSLIHILAVFWVFWRDFLDLLKFPRDAVQRRFLLLLILGLSLIHI